MSTHPPGVRRLLWLAIAACALSACEKKVTGAIPAPTEVQPQVVCNAQLTTQVTLSGTNFSPSPVDSLLSGKKLALPQVSLVRTADLSGAAASGSPEALNPDPTDASNTRVQWVSQEQMTFTVDPTLELEVGIYGVKVENPTGGTGEQPKAFAVVPPPTLTAVEPEPACTAQYENVLTARGEGFLQIGNTLPTVKVGTYETTASSATECTPVEGPLANVQLCKAITFTLPKDSVPEGAHAVVVTNPAPANCSSSEPVTYHVVAPPTVASIAPTPLCDAQGNVPVTVTGTGFLRIKDAMPSLRIGDTFVANDTRIVPETCTPIAGLVGVERCTQLTATVPQDSLEEGFHRVVVTNPQPAQCASTEQVDLEVVAPPQVASISPSTVCTGGGTFTITGQNLKGVTATLTDADGGQVQASNVAVSADGTSAEVTFGAGLRPSTYTLTVQGATGCSSTLQSQPVTVSPGPVAFYVDPPAVYNGVPVRATVYVSNLTSDPSSVAITPAGGGTETALTDVVRTSGSTLEATIPAGLAAGSYDLFIRGISSCDAFLANGLKVVSETKLQLADVAVQPAYGLAGEDVAVTLIAKATVDAAAGEVQFQATPRAYLFNASLGRAMPLRAVGFIDATHVSAIVPQTLPAGTYDLVVVNPDGTVGFKAGAFRATTIPPPLIDDVTPSQLSNDSATVITIKGKALSPVSSMAVTLTCKVAGGTPTSTVLAIDTSKANSDTELFATVPSGLSHGSACVVQVANTADSTSDEWSALSITNPASKLPLFVAGSGMNEARRAPGVAVGRATREARFLYAIGGDSGTLGTAEAPNTKRTVEMAPLGRFGEVGAWSVLQTQLPAGRSLAAAHQVAAVDAQGQRTDYLFLIGGHDGAAPVADIFRAEVLSPRKAPEVTGVDLQFAASGNGLGAGTWTYVVAAVYADADTDNPGGESLPSEPVTLYAPVVPDGVEVTLTWPTVLGAGGTPAKAYRVYRTPEVNGALTGLALLAEVPAVADAATHSFKDTNPATLADTTKRPLALGALGAWRKLDQGLSTPRAAFSFVTATDPACGRYWYAIGGMTATGAADSGYDLAAFDTATALPLAFSAQTTTGFTARRELTAWVADAQSAPGLVKAPATCDAYVYAAYGLSATDTFVTDARYAKVGAGGVLVSDEATPVANKWLEAMGAAASVQAAGQVAFMSSNGAYRLGGRSGAGPSADAVQAQLTCDLAGNCTAKLGNWSDASFDMTAARYLPGMARRGAFFYIAGGADSMDQALSSTEMNLR